MPLVITVKLGINNGEEAAAVTVRKVETGEVLGFTLEGPRGLVETLLKSLESNPDIKVKYE